ncbi:hypothetical protein FSP39_002800 [Pinctada imbricata]|uniref:BTB domain-containing protein n=1 Tax=Pinctada imbricata TaxID=66713 RepID=A0AA88YLW9_PINIB|nr:hypothetical protein FSP39_002800 [Pinctada imbricata]
MNYQKVYINQVSSTSTMDYLTQMWRNQLLCDAVIKTGDIVTKAHRVVLIAACPMLQNMENASLGSHLEVRMAADIKQDSVNAFLQYIYEGYMMLTEENCKDIEKMAKLLQVESLLNCCTDFYKNLSEKTGRQHGGPMINVKQGLNFQHLKFSNLQKTLSETALKRGGSSEEVTPGSKRQKFPSEAEKERVPSHDWNSVSQTDSSEQSNTINLVEENLEVIHTDPAARDEEGWPRWASGPGVSHSHTISVSSQRNVQSNTQVVTIPDDDSGGSVNTNKSVHSAVTNLNHRSLTSQSNIHVPSFSTHNSSLFVPQSVSYMSTHVSAANRDSPTCSRDSLNRSDYVPMTLEHQQIRQSQSVQPSSQIPYAAGSERQQRSERQQIYVAPLSELPRSENFKVEEHVSDRTTVNDDRSTQISEQKNSEYIDNSHIDSQKVSELLSGDTGQPSNIR